MSLLLLSRVSKVCLEKPALGRYALILSNGFSSSLLQTPPCCIVCTHGGKLAIMNANEHCITQLEKKVPWELINKDPRVTIGASHGWVATLKDDGILRLQDDLNPVASDTDPKRIPLPPLVTLPHCQTKIVTNVSMSSSSPEDDEDCVVAVKFLGPQLSFCRPAQSNSEWTNIRIQNSCFHSSRVMFSERDGMFCIPGSGGHLIASWDLHKDKDNHKPKFQRLRFQNLPAVTKTKQELMDSCCTSEHLVESRSTGETFLVKQYKKTADIDIEGVPRTKTEALMVFKLDGEGNAVYTKDIGDLCIFISNSEPFCVPASSFPGMHHNHLQIHDVDGYAFCRLADYSIVTEIPKSRLMAPYFIPPQLVV